MIYIDQMMREVRLDKPPSRIICLVPSITELLSDMGLDEKIAGITKFCIHPDHIFRTKTRVGGTKKVDHEKIKSLHPDLIIANKEENSKSDIDILKKQYQVWISDIRTLEDAVEMIEKLGELTGKAAEAKKICISIAEQFRKLKPAQGLKAIYLIWREPFMAAGCETFIDDMMKRCGLKNVLGNKKRYPVLSESQIRELNPELILLSSEPYPFKEKHISELKKSFPQSNVVLADGEYFSWYGSRLIGAPLYFNSLFHQP